MRTSAAFLPLLMIVMPLHPTSARAEQIVLGAAKDNTLYESNTGSLSNGIGQYLFSGMTKTAERRRTVLAFDIAGNIPAGSAINSVRLQLNVSRQIGGTHSSALHRLTSDWGEGNSNSTFMGGGGGAPAAANDATWLHTFFSGSLWTTEGGDFIAQSSASIDITGDGMVVWGSNAAMVADVQGWLNAPASNFGWIIISNETTIGSTKRFDSRENLTIANRPALVIDYNGTAVESATWGTTKALFR